MIIRPQEGPQTEFVQTDADIAIYGGSAGAGKTFGLLLPPLYHIDNPKYSAVIFRRNSTQIRNPGGLWDESTGLYKMLGAEPRIVPLEWRFLSGMKVKFAHLEHELSVHNWQGAQIAYIGFDELIHFTEKQFFYMLSRLRSMSGVKGEVRATCNPDVDSWVRRFIDWWIGEDGFPIWERSGILRYFIRVGDNIIWADSAEELIDRHGDKQIPKSFTFIPALIQHNKILLEKDPAYLSNLMALSLVDRERLLRGNWNIRPCAGNFFRREWFSIVDAIPSGFTRSVRFWDRAATIPNETNPDPDWTRGLKLYRYPNGTYCVGDLRSARDTPLKIENLIKNVAAHDTISVKVVSQQDPGSAGVLEAEHFIRSLGGYDVQSVTISKDKITRAKPVSAQVEAGNIMVLRAPWNDEFFNELENFPSENSHDDIVDTLSGAFNILQESPSLADAYWGYR